MNRCFGIARNLHLCRRTGEWRLFCHEHRRQPLVWLFVLVFTVFAGISSIKSAWWPLPWRTCTADASVSSDIVSRVYFRGTVDPDAKQQTLIPTSQELFYEWQISFTAHDTVHKLSFEIHHLQVDDSVSLRPATAGILSEPSKWWYSGFSEPKRLKPDYFIRTVVLPELSAGSSVALVARRALEKPALAVNDLITMENLYATDCRMKRTPVAENAERLQNLAARLAKNVYGNKSNPDGVPIRPDPGDVGKHEMQATVEMRCKDEACTSMETRQLEARMGKSPQEYMKERQTEQLESLKKDLESILPCIEAPQPSSDPTQDSQFIQLCGDPVHLSAEDMERLMAIFRKHGMQLDMRTPPSAPAPKTLPSQ